ncbi:MAG TPA: histidinol-phosphate transaminase [Candidatus Fimenecus excrementigallinarum]|uniref:Histidinol-phosphate aminotransferase n=1 Tax=Candidatus Fimenecus excrementigallinarum TaxID=2840816 RepID=A0A9D1IFM9_9FIRM|nr:histidinol-phosphate transaminase [Candidatus Fimenecus excrementigallinarum]
MFELNEKIRNLKPYDPVTGSYQIRLDANESFVTPSQALREQMDEALCHLHFNRYPDPYAVELRQAFADLYGVPRDCVMAGNGSDEVITVVMNAFLQKGDTVVTLAPDFSMYGFYASLVECKTVAVPKNADCTVDADRVIETVRREKARMLVFSNPCNPTSLVLARETVRKIVSSVSALVVLDEAYMDFSDQSMLSEFAGYDNLLILKTCSKALGMAALRLGFAVGQQKLIDALQAAKSPYNVNALSQAVGTAVLLSPAYLASSVQRILESRDELYAGFCRLADAFPAAALEICEPAANFLYIRTPRAGAIFEALKAAGIIVRLFDGALRITAGRNYENEAVLRAAEDFLKGADA